MAMRKISPIVGLGAIVAICISSGCSRTSPEDDIPGDAAQSPKLILIIGDGMDDHQITIARNYLHGQNGRLVLDDMTWRSSVQVRTVLESDPSSSRYVGDSANSATAMATGILTSAGRIATTAATDEDATTILELASAAGFGTGIVTTASVTDATPASFVAHINQRLCQSPRSMVSTNAGNPQFSTNCSADLIANGGRGSIAEQIADSRLDIILGGGLRQFDQPAEAEAETTVLDIARSNGFTVITQADALTTIEPGERVLGLFAGGTMPVRWRGTNDAVAEPIARDSTGQLVPHEAFSCEPEPGFAGTPTLAQMTRAALSQFDSSRSFALVVESASIDKQSHLRRPCGQIGELQQLDETLALALEYSTEHPETLILVTADHGQAAQLIPEASLFAAQNYATPGYFARLRTREGAVMGVNYPTNDSPIQEDHTGTQVPLLANAVPSGNLPAMIQQTEIFGIMLRHLGLSPP